LGNDRGINDGVVGGSSLVKGGVQRKGEMSLQNFNLIT